MSQGKLRRGDTSSKNREGRGSVVLVCGGREGVCVWEGGERGEGGEDGGRGGRVRRGGRGGRGGEGWQSEGILCKLWSS